MPVTQGMIDLPDYLRSQALDPKWNEAGRVHDWRNYISERVQKMWDTFTDEQKLALVEQANDQASQEEWD